MADNKKLNVPLTFVRTLPGGNLINPNQVEQLASTIKPVPGLIGAANLSPERLGATYAGDRRLNRSREQSEAKSFNEPKTPTKNEKGGSRIQVLIVARIFNRKLYQHFQSIKDTKRKLTVKRGFLKTLSVLEQAKMMHHKSFAWFTLLRNSYQIDKASIDKSAKVVAKAKESNIKRCMLLLRKRYTNLMKISLERIRKKCKKVSLMVHPFNSLLSIMVRKLLQVKQRAFFRIRRFGKRKDIHKLGCNFLKNVFKNKLAQHLLQLRSLPPKAGAAPAIVTSKVGVEAGRQARSVSTSSATQSAQRRGMVTPTKKQPAPREEDKLNAQIEELSKQKEVLNAQARSNIEAIDANIQELERRIEQQTNRKAELEKKPTNAPPTPDRTQKPQRSSPVSSAIQETRDPYYEILKNIYDIVSGSSDTLRKRDIVTQFELDLDQLEDTVEHELDRNQQLKDTINHIEDFLCPDQAIERPQLQIDEANRLLEHENSQLKKVLQRYLVESYGKNLYEQAKKTYNLLAERVGQSRGSPARS